MWETSTEIRALTYCATTLAPVYIFLALAIFVYFFVFFHSFCIILTHLFYWGGIHTWECMWFSPLSCLHTILISAWHLYCCVRQEIELKINKWIASERWFGHWLRKGGWARKDEHSAVLELRHAMPGAQDPYWKKESYLNTLKFFNELI